MTIVGAGISGLVAAIEAAERGWRVTVAEAHSQPGGRARSLGSGFRANLGPHAIYADGPLWSWLEGRGLTPPVVAAPAQPPLVRMGGRLGRRVPDLGEAIAVLPAGAPADESFRDWLRRHVDPTTAEAIVGLTFIVTYDHDPGRLSAEFCYDRLRRALAGGARYVVGGWSTVVNALTRRAISLGVQLRLRTRVMMVSTTPTVVATSLAAARRVTGDQSLRWTGARTAALDYGLQTNSDVDWFRLLDLDDRIYAARYSLADSTLAPPGHELIQVAAACQPWEHKADVQRRVNQLLDEAWPGWRGSVRWHRGAVLTDCTGAVEMPGMTWRDRPRVDRGTTLKVATDQSAAPGLLAEVGAAAAVLAVGELSDAFAVGLPPSPPTPSPASTARGQTATAFGSG